MQAGFTTEKDSLLLALEPEAASLHCIENIEDLLGDSSGGHHLVVDCGGGTVDVVAHKWLRVSPGNRLCVDETHKVHGGPCGSFAINVEFEKFLIKIFKVNEAHLRLACGVQWSKLLYEEFERVKCDFEDCNLESTSTVNVPKIICTYIENLHGKTMSKLIDEHKNTLDKDLNLSQRLHNITKKFNLTTSQVSAAYNELKWDDENGDIVVPSVIMALLFVPVTKQIVKIIEDVLNADKDQSIKSICMVGGFSESKFLFSEVHEYFSPRVQVKTIPSPSCSVLFGSVKFGKNHKIIRSRIVSQTLGIETWDDFQSDKHDESRKYDTNGKSYCTKVFTEFVRVGQSILTETSNTQAIQRISPAVHDEHIRNKYHVSVYGSFEEKPEYIDSPNCYLAGEMVIDLPPTCTLTVHMDVRGTEIAVTAYAGDQCDPLNLTLDWMKNKYIAR